MNITMRVKSWKQFMVLPHCPMMTLSGLPLAVIKLSINALKCTVMYCVLFTRDDLKSPK